MLVKANKVKSAIINKDQVEFETLGGGLKFQTYPLASRGGKNQDKVTIGLYVSFGPKLELYKDLNYDLDEVINLQKTNPLEYEKKRKQRIKELDEDERKILEAMKKAAANFEKELKSLLGKLGYKE